MDINTQTDSLIQDIYPYLGGLHRTKLYNGTLTALELIRHRLTATVSLLAVFALQLGESSIYLFFMHSLNVYFQRYAFEIFPSTIVHVHLVCNTGKFYLSGNFIWLLSPPSKLSKSLPHMNLFDLISFINLSINGILIVYCRFLLRNLFIDAIVRKNQSPP